MDSTFNHQVKWLVFFGQSGETNLKNVSLVKFKSSKRSQTAGGCQPMDPVGLGVGCGAVSNRLTTSWCPEGIGATSKRWGVFSLDAEPNSGPTITTFHSFFRV